MSVAMFLYLPLLAQTSPLGKESRFRDYFEITLLEEVLKLVHHKGRKALCLQGTVVIGVEAQGVMQVEDDATDAAICRGSAVVSVMVIVLIRFGIC